MHGAEPLALEFRRAGYWTCGLLNAAAGEAGEGTLGGFELRIGFEGSAVGAGGQAEAAAPSVDVADQGERKGIVGVPAARQLALGDGLPIALESEEGDGEAVAGSGIARRKLEGAAAQALGASVIAVADGFASQPDEFPDARIAERFVLGLGVFGALAVGGLRVGRRLARPRVLHRQLRRVGIAFGGLGGQGRWGERLVALGSFVGARLVRRLGFASEVRRFGLRLRSRRRGDACGAFDVGRFGLQMPGGPASPADREREGRREPDGFAATRGLGVDVDRRSLLVGLVDVLGACAGRLRVWRTALLVALGRVGRDRIR